MSGMLDSIGSAFASAYDTAAEFGAREIGIYEAINNGLRLGVRADF